MKSASRKALFDCILDSARVGGTSLAWDIGTSLPLLSLKNLRFLWVLALVLVSPLATRAESLNYYFHPAERFRVTFPASFIEVPPESPVVVLNLHSPDGYPTVNIIVQPGTYLAHATDLDTQKEELLESYRTFGISDASITKVFRSNLNGKNAFTAEIKYQNAGLTMVSSVTLVSGRKRHFVITFTDTESNFKTSQLTRDTIVESFVSPDDRIEIPKEAADSKLKWWEFLVIFISATLTIYLIRR